MSKTKIPFIAISMGFLMSCDAIVDAETRSKALKCHLVEESDYKLDFNYQGNGTGANPLGNGDVLFSNFVVNPTPAVVTTVLNRVDDGRRYQNWRTPFELNNGVKGEIIDSPHNSCISDALGQDYPYQIVITDWGSSVGPFTTPIVPVGCCAEIDV